MGDKEYLRVVSSVLTSHTPVRTDRTGTGTLSVFGAQMRFDLSDGFPLLTTKRVHFKAIVDELLWFISGSTDARVLSSKGTKIWDAHASREFLDKSGLTARAEGDLGPVYGFQWRHYGAEYTNMHADYTGKGIDQLANVIHAIKTTPYSRRIIMSAWNPADVPLMSLPPCHTLVQFYVSNGKLSSHLYQRSGDLGLGVPFNIASYALLTHLIAHVCGLQPGEFIHTLGDAHVYLDHIDPLTTQLARQPRPPPTIHINRAVTDIDKFTAADIGITGYDPHPFIHMHMSV